MNPNEDLQALESASFSDSSNSLLESCLSLGNENASTSNLVAPERHTHTHNNTSKLQDRLHTSWNKTEADKKLKDLGRKNKEVFDRLAEKKEYLDNLNKLKQSQLELLVAITASHDDKEIVVKLNQLGDMLRKL
ncbi:hypothetical protein DAMA08_000570 [Martiniozyma asiatica (nom. inval.)]|nr:hypothetical protein DAMA08_000570 [Martiniozyma asiatica]